MMTMSLRAFVLAGSAIGTVGLASAAAAQQTAGGQDETRLPEVHAQGEGAVRPYALQAPIDSGTVVIDRDAIDANAPGSGDVTQLLKILPTIQFSTGEGVATPEDIQDLRPADISISGGRYYDNQFTIDGIDVSAAVDVTQTNDNHYGEPVGASSQGIFLDANLIESVTVRDSNVSAEFGRFTGGAMDVRTRDPRHKFGLNFSVNYISDALTSYVLDDAMRTRLGSNTPAEPEYSKLRIGGSVDIPIGDRLALLFAYNHSEALVRYHRAAAYGGDSFGQTSTNDSYMGRLLFDVSDSVKLTGQVSYNPYRMESEGGAGRNNQITSHGGGWLGTLGVEGGTALHWSLQGSYSRTDSGRRAPANFYSYQGGRASWGA